MNLHYFRGFFSTRGASLNGGSMKRCAIILALHKEHESKRSASLNVTEVQHTPNLWAELGGNGNRFDTRGRLNK